MQSIAQNKIKAIVLGLCVLLANSFVFYTIISRLHPAPSKQTVPANTKTASVHQGGSVGSGTPAVVTAAFVVPESPPSDHPVNPFASPAPDNAGRLPLAQQAPAPAAISSGGSHTSAMPVSLPPMGAVSSSGSGTAASYSAGGPMLAPAAVVPILLKGIIVGNPSLAILQAGNEIVNCNQGQSLPGGWKVIKIKFSGVTLEQNGHYYLLDVGHGIGQNTQGVNNLTP